MRYSRGLFGLVGLLAAFIAVPNGVHGQQPAGQTQEQHDHEHQAAGAAQADGATAQGPGMMNRGTMSQDMMNPDMMKMMSDMKARDVKLDALVQKMNAAKGTSKTDAMAELLTALVEDRKAMHSSMMGMMPTMNGPMGGHGPAEQTNPKQ